jgi:hypothetical protein
LAQLSIWCKIIIIISPEVLQRHYHQQQQLLLLLFLFRTQTSTRLLPSSSYSCCTRNLHPGSLAPVPRGCASSKGIDGVRLSLFCLAAVHGERANTCCVLIQEQHGFALFGLALPLHSALPSPFADLAWLVAWLSRLPCRNWCSITSSHIIIVLLVLHQRPGLCYLYAALWLLLLPGLGWCFCGLDYAFAYACFHDTSMGHYTWYLVPCIELVPCNTLAPKTDKWHNENTRNEVAFTGRQRPLHRC